ncbi:MAG: hypothetical protein Kapaf2KO_20050 [Candidatus Kapaibacteriales bacterium]
MKSLLIGGDLSRWNYKERLAAKDYMNGIESWVYALEGDYISAYYITPKIFAEYDLIIINIHHTNDKYLSKVLEAISVRKPNQKVVGLIEGDASLFLSPNTKALAIMAECDFINVINKLSLDFFSLLSGRPCYYLGIPYPYQNINKLKIQYKTKDTGVLACSFVSSRNLDLLVAHKLGIKVTCYEKRFSRKLKNIKLYYNKYNSINLDSEVYFNDTNNYYNKADSILREKDLENYFKTNAEFYLWINIDNRHTWGRCVLDAAALGVPIVTTKSTGHGEYLFPETTIDDWKQIDKAIEKAEKLLSDQKFYEDVISYADEKFPNLSHETMKKKLLEFL